MNTKLRCSITIFLLLLFTIDKWGTLFLIYVINVLATEIVGKYYVCVCVQLVVIRSYPLCLLLYALSFHAIVTTECVEVRRVAE